MILFQIKRLTELGVYKETFVKGIYKTLSGAHLYKIKVRK